MGISLIQKITRGGGVKKKTNSLKFRKIDSEAPVMDFFQQI